MPTSYAKNVQAQLARDREAAGYGPDWRWKWDKDMLWNGVAERKKEKHSRYFLAIMAKHPRTAMDKDVTVLVPWLDSTLRSLQIDPLLPALHCQAQRLTPTTKEQCYMADMMAELCRFRVPGHSDQGYKLYKAVVAAWPDPTKVVRFDVDDGLTMSEAIIDPQRGSGYQLSEEEVAIVREVIHRWRRLVPPMTDQDLVEWLAEQLHTNRASASLPLARDLLLGTLGYRLKFFWTPHLYTAEERARLSRATTNFKIVLQRFLATGGLFDSIESPESEVDVPASHRFMTVSEDRARLLAYVKETFAIKETGEVEAFRLALDFLDGSKWSKTQRSDHCRRLALAWNGKYSRLQVDGFIEQVRFFAKTFLNGKHETMKWSARDICFYLKFAFELGTNNSDDINTLMRARNCLPSAEAVATSHHDHRLALRFAAHAGMLRRCCPRWWAAMGLPEDPVEAWMQERGRGGRILGADAVEQVEGTVPELCVMDDPNSGYPLSVLSTIEDVIQYANTQHFSTADDVMALKEKAATEAAILNRAMSRIIDQI